MQLTGWKDSSPNDLLCVEWDVKRYTLTHSMAIRFPIYFIYRPI